MNIVLVGAPIISAPANPWPGVEISWVSPDGASSWVLTDMASPVRLLAGTRGLTMPRLDRFTDTTPALHGSRWRGWRAQERQVFWPVVIYAGDSTQQHLDIDAAFWASLSPEDAGTWRVTTPDGSARELRLRLDSEDTAWEFSPGLVDWSTYEVYLVAEQPFWTSEPITRDFTGTSDGARFADPATPALWHISGASSAATATLTNPGGVDGFPVWWLHGPSTTAHCGIGSTVVEVPFEIPDGKTLVVDADPADRRAMLITTPAGGVAGLNELPLVEQVALVRAAVASSGVNRTKDLGSATGFAAIPKGQRVPLNIAFAGAGSIRVLLTPRHFRAWG